VFPLQVWEVAAGLGVGAFLALVFYGIVRQFGAKKGKGIETSRLGAEATAIIAVLILLIGGAITIVGLVLYAPRAEAARIPTDPQEEPTAYSRFRSPLTREQLIKRYDLELENRFSKMRHELAEYEAGHGNIYRAYGALTQNQHYELTFKEFEAMSGLTLMFELAELVDDAKDRSKIETARNAIEQLKAIGQKYESMFQTAVTDGKGVIHLGGKEPGELDRISKEAHANLKAYLKTNAAKFERWVPEATR
jgi:hypothetical protein